MRSNEKDWFIYLLKMQTKEEHGDLGRQIIQK